MARSPRVVAIVGAGPVGSMLALLLARAGHRVHIFERRSEHALLHGEGRDSTHVMISARGWSAIHEAGLDARVRALSTPLCGRAIHLPNGQCRYESFDRDGRTLLCLQRIDVQRTVFEAAVAQPNVTIDIGRPISGITEAEDEVARVVGRRPDFVAGCDGVNSAIRRELVAARVVSETIEEFLWRNREFQLLTPLRDRDRANIWPAGRQSIFAFPTIDGTATGTLFFPGSSAGEASDEETRLAIEHIVGPDVRFELPGGRRAGRFLQLNAHPLTFERVALLGDAAHATTPFLGQGMNAGFEETAVLSEAFETHDSVAGALAAYARRAERHGAALVELSRRHFEDLTMETSVEVRAQRTEVSDWMDRELGEELPPFYELVAFTRVGFADILETYRLRHELMERLLTRRMTTQGTEALTALLPELRETIQHRLPAEARNAERVRY
jgi:kynurenine 3-monooxygenase